MFSRGRPCLRRRLSAALDTVAAGPDEPLLFLYPQWAASALRQRRQFTRSTTNTARVGGRRAPSRSLGEGICRGSPSLPTFCRQSSQWISSNAAAAQAHDGSRSEVIYAEEKVANSIGKEESAEGTGSDCGTKNVPATGPKRPVGSLAHVADVTTSSAQRKSRRQPVTSETFTQHSTTATASGLTRKAVPAKKVSVRDRRKLRYGSYLDAQDTGHLYHRPVGSWGDMRDLLEKIESDPRTGVRKGTRHKEIFIPEETVALLAGVTDTGMKDNVWYVHVRNGCRVHILHPREGDGVHRKAILSGSEHVMELVEGEINRAHKMQVSGDPLVEVAKPPVPIFASTLSVQQQDVPVPLVRGTWSLDQRSPMTMDEVLASHPCINSVKGFAEYIEDLTLSRGPRIDQKARTRRVPHNELVARQIMAVFRQSSSHKFISTAALNRALIYLCDHEFLSTARVVFSIAEQVATVDTYNILLKSAARRQDKREFRRFLRSMSRAHIRPNPQTWLALLEAVVTPSAKASLLNQMVHKGYMNEISTIRSALQLTIEDSLFVHLESGQSIDSFVALMVRTHGADWFSPSLLAQMFAVIARLKHYTAMESLLKICTEHRLALDSDSLVQIMLMFRASVFSAVQYTIQFLNRPMFRLSREAYERLFLIAFKARRYNLCRVLWRYACMDRAVTYKMKQAVLSSLTRNVSVKKDSNDIGNIWRVGAGKVIVGLDLHRERYKIQESLANELPPEFRQNPLLFLTSGFKAQGPDRDLQHRLANLLVKRDIHLGATAFRPRYSLSMMLESAAILDREWAGKPWPLTWTMQNAIKVAIKRRRNHGPN